MVSSLSQSTTGNASLRRHKVGSAQVRAEMLVYQDLKQDASSSFGTSLPLLYFKKSSDASLAPGGRGRGRRMVFRRVKSGSANSHNDGIWYRR